MRSSCHQLPIAGYAFRSQESLFCTGGQAPGLPAGGRTAQRYGPDQDAGLHAVHSAGGRIFLQLWHVGRISHPCFQPDGALPVAPSPIRPKGQVFTGKEMVDYVTPRALETSELPGIIAEYIHGAQLAKEAGFDGVEIHNANGYLLDQFLRSGTNHRTDSYGGSVANRCRLPLEIAQAVIQVWGADRVGIRLSPSGVFNDMHDDHPMETFSHLLQELSKLRLVYTHITRVTAQDTAGGFDRSSGEQAITEGWADAICYGVPFLANPDLPERLRKNAPLNPPDEATFYASGPKGYTDYPTLA
ncbi:MAG: alkene reductase [Verrucomicrobia bacterium]|nr:alkene reductase [Verrucomicrobiota bacterium]